MSTYINFIRALATHKLPELSAYLSTDTLVQVPPKNFLALSTINKQSLKSKNRCCESET